MGQASSCARRFIASAHHERTLYEKPQNVGCSGEGRTTLQICGGEALHSGYIWRSGNIARNTQGNNKGDVAAERRITVRRQRMRMTIQRTGGQRTKSVGRWTRRCTTAVMLPRAAATRRSLGLRLHHGRTKSREEEQQQQAGNWAPHKPGFYLITAPCDMNGWKPVATDSSTSPRRRRPVTVAAPVRPKDVRFLS